MTLKPLTKKEIKAFVKTYNDILEIMCDLYNHQDKKVGKNEEAEWKVGYLDPKLVAMNNLHISVPIDGTFDVIRIVKENNNTMKYDLLRVKVEDLISKKALEELRNK